MSNLTRYRNGHLFFRDPFSLARDAFQGDPWFASPAKTREQTAFVPRFDVKETEGAYVFTADMPGVKSDDLDISLVGNQLTIAGKRESVETKEGDKHFMEERRFGSFTRSFALPDEADGDSVKADLRDGVLQLTVAKKAQAQPKKITVSAG